MSGAMLRVHMECMLQVLGESKRSQGCSALYADACQQIADAIRVRCNQVSVLCGRFAPPLPPAFFYTSPHDQMVVVEVASIPANASFASTTSIVCSVSIFQSAIFHSLCLGRLWKGFSRRRTRAVLGVTSA